MGERGAVEALLAEHEWEWKSLGTRIVLACKCGDELIPKWSSGVATLADHRAHLADLLDGHVRKAEARVLREAADEVDRGPTFPLPPSVISELLRERAARVVRGGGDG